ncbi:hypothetical protein SR870_08720 [Rhodopseudomonas palustris]|nr:hypothetical protein [Rhodopseudomonas palustris]WQH01338.1 hypothetical protein SR870_08720 [Rhodopseudomonas palustris]
MLLGLLAGADGVFDGHLLDFSERVLLRNRSRERNRRIEQLALCNPGAVELADALIELLERPRKPDASHRQLHVAHFRFGDQRLFRNLGLDICEPRRFTHLRFGDGLVHHHADRKRNADEASDSEFVPDSIELEHLRSSFDVAKHTVGL